MTPQDIDKAITQFSGRTLVRTTEVINALLDLRNQLTAEKQNG